MIGRASRGNPWLFREVLAVEDGRPVRRARRWPSATPSGAGTPSWSSEHTSPRDDACTSCARPWPGIRAGCTAGPELRHRCFAELDGGAVLELGEAFFAGLAEREAQRGRPRRAPAVPVTGSAGSATPAGKAAAGGARSRARCDPARPRRVRSPPGLRRPLVPRDWRDHRRAHQEERTSCPAPAIERLRKIGRRAVPQIETAMHTASARGKVNLVAALDAIGEPESAAVLQHFAVYDPSPEVRPSLRRAARQVGGRERRTNGPRPASPGPYRREASTRVGAVGAQFIATALNLA